MAISAAQRNLALNEIFMRWSNDQAVAEVLPGVTRAQIINFLLAAIGTSADAQFTTVCNAMAATYGATVTQLQTAETNANATKTTWTVV